jgi:hypothetical protein
LSARALIIAAGRYLGVGELGSDRFAPLEFAQRYARDCVTLFGRISGATNVALIADPTSRQIDEALQSLGSRTGKEAGEYGMADQGLVVHFIGHGLVDEASRVFYLAGVDGRPLDPAGSCVDLLHHLNRFDRARYGRHVLFLLDACESGRAARYLMEGDRLIQNARPGS